MAVIASEKACRIDDDAWISCSHWGLFPAPTEDAR